MLSEMTKRQIKKRLLEKYNLKKIILFGSQARGTADDKSDVDLLIITDIEESKFKMMNDLRQALLPINYAFDVIVVSEDEYQRDKKYPGTTSRYASIEGELIYEC